MCWYLYILQCADDTLYTGITTDLVRRVKEHNCDNKLGAKSLRGKRPVRVIYREIYQNRMEAAKREKAIKNWTREGKLNLIKRA